MHEVALLAVTRGDAARTVEASEARVLSGGNAVERVVDAACFGLCDGLVRGSDDDVDPIEPPGPIAVVVGIAQQHESALGSLRGDVVGPGGGDRSARGPQRHVGGDRAERRLGDASGQVAGRLGEADRQPVAARLHARDMPGLLGEVRLGADDVAEKILPITGLGMRGLRLRSIVYLKVCAVTGWFEGGEKRMPGSYHERVRTTVGTHRRQRAGGFGYEAQAGRARLVGIVEEHRAGRVQDLRRVEGAGHGRVEFVDEARHADDCPATRGLGGRRRLHAHPDLAVDNDQGLWAAADLHRRGDVVAARVDPHQRAVAAVRDPYVAAADRDRARRAAHRDRRDHRVRGRVDRLDGIVERVGDPDGVLADGDGGRAASDRDPRGGAVGVDAEKHARLAIGEPRAAEPDGDGIRRCVDVRPPERAPVACVDPCQQSRARRDDHGIPARGE